MLGSHIACIDDSGNVIVIVRKLNRYVSIKPSSPASNLLLFIGTILSNRSFAAKIHTTNPPHTYKHCVIQ